jgi:hypothetical protein
VSAHQGAWFSALGETLGEAERADIAAYLRGLALECPVHTVTSWRAAVEICARPAEAWWNAEEAERTRLEERARLDPAAPDWIALNETLHGAAALAAARAGCSDAAWIRAAAGAGEGHPFLRKYALYCGGRWPLGVYEGTFAIF